MSFNNRKNARAGQFWTINNRAAAGHKGRLSKINKKGKFKAVVVTHHPSVKIPGRRRFRTIQLNKNPNKNDTQNAYALPYSVRGNVNKHLGTRHPEMKVVDKRDKSIFRKIGNKK